MGKRNMVEEMEEICRDLRKNRNEGMEQMRQLIPKLQKMLPFYMEAGVRNHISQGEWLVVLQDVMTAMERADMVLLVDALEYGLKELIEQTGYSEEREGILDESTGV